MVWNSRGYFAGWSVAAVSLLILAGRLPAEEHADGTADHSTPAQRIDSPAIPQPTHMPAVMLMVIGGMFVCAIAAGIVLRTNMDEPTDSHAHGDGHDRGGGHNTRY